MTNPQHKARGWHRVMVEWSDGLTTTCAGLEIGMADEGIGVDSAIATSLACALKQAGLSELLVAAEMLAHLESDQDDPCAETLAQAAGRYLRRRRGDWDK